VIVVGVNEWMRANSRGEFTAKDATSIGWHDGKRVVAGVAYTDWNGANLNMHVVALPGKRWLRREFLWACFDYPFNRLKVARVTGVVASCNAEARRFDEHLGFTLEATLQGAHPSGDLLVYVLWKSSCRWLSLRPKGEYGQVIRAASA
jgi:RimJ/RimL family protein N-acetyltransferase